MHTPSTATANTPRVIAIVGPTASGKTSLAIDVAKRYHGEIISADSRQVYKGLDIGTGKVTPEEMDGVPHHLIDIVDLDTIYTAADFVRDAAAAIADITDRSRLPIIAGGTNFYLDLLRGKQQVAPVAPNPELRAKLEEQSTAELHAALREYDPKRADNIDASNRRRLIRALEITSVMGSVPNAPTAENPYDMCIIGLEVEKETLREKFSRRLEEWLARGFEAEVQALLQNKVFQKRLPELGFEYTLMAAYVRDEITLAELKQRFVEKNWQYAKRQLAWLKRDEEIAWYAPENRGAIFRRLDTFLHAAD